jgi:hypothetical protein
MNRHETDPVSLVFGLVFLVVVAFWLLTKALEFSWPSIGWFFAGGLIVLGAAGVIAGLRPRRS